MLDYLRACAVRRDLKANALFLQNYLEVSQQIYRGD